MRFLVLCGSCRDLPRSPELRLDTLPRGWWCVVVWCGLSVLFCFAYFSTCPILRLGVPCFERSRPSCVVVDLCCAFCCLICCCRGVHSTRPSSGRTRPTRSSRGWRTTSSRRASARSIPPTPAFPCRTCARRYEGRSAPAGSGSGVSRIDRTINIQFRRKPKSFLIRH